MLNPKMTKLVSVFFALLMVITVLTPLAKAKAEKGVQTEDLFIETVTPYIILDSSKTYKLSSEAYNQLDFETIEKANKLINDTNSETLNERSNMSISPDGLTLTWEPPTLGSTPTVEPPVYYESSPQPTAEYTAGFTTQAVGTKNIKFSFKWYGPQIWFSSSAVKKFRDYIYVYGAGIAGVNTAMLMTFAYYSVTPPGWLSSLVTCIAGFGAWAFISRDKGCGVYIRFWWTSVIPTVWNAC